MSSTNLLLFNTANAASYKASALEAVCTGGHATEAQEAEARSPSPNPRRGGVKGGRGGAS